MSCSDSGASAIYAHASSIETGWVDRASFRTISSLAKGNRFTGEKVKDRKKPVRYEFSDRRVICGAELSPPF
jgi:hypothetical protein